MASFRLAAVPSFTGLRRFPEGRNFKQWTGDDSKGLMKTFLPAIKGLVPDRVVKAIAAFMEFCYLARRSELDEETRFLPAPPALHETLLHIHPNVWCTQWPLFIHYRIQARPRCQGPIPPFESPQPPRPDAVDGNPSPCNLRLPPALLNPTYASASASNPHQPTPTVPTGEANGDDGVVEGQRELADVQDGLRVRLSNGGVPSRTPPQPSTSGVHSTIPVDENLRIRVFHSATAKYYAPSDLSGVGGMRREIIRSSPGFLGLGVAQVLMFFSFHYENIRYQCALVSWFERTGDEPCGVTGMWKVRPDLSQIMDDLIPGNLNLFRHPSIHRHRSTHLQACKSE